jgi:SAM-dependent methyltransferase
MSVSAVSCPIPCNLCSSLDIEQIADRDRDGRPLRTTICRRCGLVWSNPRPGQEDIRRYYSREYRLDYKGRATPSLRHIARSGRGALNRHRALSPFLNAGDRILDVGAGSGEVVYVFRRLGFDVRGLEPDEQYARHAREALGVPVDTGFVQDASFPPGSFDAVTMYHALEHVEDPVGVLRTIRGWLKSGGVLVLEVPNVEARCILPAHRFHFAHFYNFNRATLEATGVRAGFDPVQTTTSQDEGNLIAVFRASAAPGADTIELGGNYARVARAVGGHTAANYYLSRAPYAGPLGRLRNYLADRAAARGARTPTEVLDSLIGRART